VIQETIQRMILNSLVGDVEVNYRSGVNDLAAQPGAVAAVDFAWGFRLPPNPVPCRMTGCCRSVTNTKRNAAVRSAIFVETHLIGHARSIHQGRHSGTEVPLTYW